MLHPAWVMLTGVGRTETCTFFHNVESAGRDAVETCVVVIYAHPPGRDADKHVALRLSSLPAEAGGRLILALTAHSS